MSKLVYLCHEEPNEAIAIAKDFMHRSGIKYSDCESDIAPNQQILTQMDRLIPKADWVVIFGNNLQAQSEIFTYQKDMAVSNAISKRRRNIIIVCNVHQVSSLPSDLTQFPCIVLENRNWTDELLNTIAQNSVNMEKGTCRNKSHLDIERELHRTGFGCLSEPECLPLSDENVQNGFRHSVIPPSQKQKVQVHAKRRNLQNDGTPSKPREDKRKQPSWSKFRRLTRQTQKKNWFYRQYMTRIAHSETCVCYFFQVCNMLNLITNVHFLFWLLMYTLTERNLHYETNIFHILVNFVHICPLFMFWNCSELFKELRLFKHYRNVCVTQLCELALFSYRNYRVTWLITYYKMPPNLNFLCTYLLLKITECIAYLTIFLSLNNRDKSSRYTSAARNVVVFILIFEVLYIRKFILVLEWDWLYVTYSFRPLTKVLLTIALCTSWFCQLYSINAFFRDIYNDTAVPECAMKCCRLQRSFWNMNVVLGFLLWFYYFQRFSLTL